MLKALYFIASFMFLSSAYASDLLTQSWSEIYFANTANKTDKIQNDILSNLNKPPHFELPAGSIVQPIKPLWEEAGQTVVYGRIVSTPEVNTNRLIGENIWLKSDAQNVQSIDLTQTQSPIVTTKSSKSWLEKNLAPLLAGAVIGGVAYKAFQYNQENKESVQAENIQTLQQIETVQKNLEGHNCNDCYLQNQTTAFTVAATETPQDIIPRTTPTQFVTSNKDGFAFRRFFDEHPGDGWDPRERTWDFFKGKKAQYIEIFDKPYGATNSLTQTSYIYLFPQKCQQSFQEVKNKIIVTLPTCEKVEYQGNVKSVKGLKMDEVKLMPGSAFTEGPLKDRCLDKKGKLQKNTACESAHVNYMGQGVMIRLDGSFGSLPIESKTYATVISGSQSCKVKISALFPGRQDIASSNTQALNRILKQEKCNIIIKE